MKITFSSNFGNFDYALSAQVDPAQLIVFGGLGLGQVAQRTPCTLAEKAMVGDSWPKNKKGEPSGPKGFERGSIEYSEEFAEILRSHLAQLKNDSGATVEGIEVSVSEKQDKVESKWAYEKGLIAGKNGDVARLAKLAQKVGYEIQNDDEAEIATELVAENVEFCKAIREHNKAVLAREMAD